jgi:flagellin-specific chaperone FliS
MRDAVLALESAIAELRQAEESLPDDMTEQVRSVIERATELLEQLRAKESS